MKSAVLPPNTTASLSAEAPTADALTAYDEAHSPSI